MTQAKIMMAALAAAAAFAAPVASAQQSGMITVDMSAVSASVAKNLSVEAGKVPATIQVPVGIAAKACGVSASVLTQQGGTGAAATCQAKTTDTALEQLVQKELATTAMPEKK